MAPMTGVAQSVLDLVDERKVTESTLNEQPKDEHQVIGGMKQDECDEIVSDGQSCATIHDHAYDHQIDHLPSAPLNESASLICSFAECVDLTFNHLPSLLRHTRLKHSQSLHPIHCKPFTNVRRPTQSNHVLKIVVTDKMACSLCDKWFQWHDDLEIHVIQEHTVRTVVTAGFGECSRAVKSDEELERHRGVHQQKKLCQQAVHQVIELNKSSNQSSFDCPHNQLLPGNQQQTLQQPQRQQINLDQFYPNQDQLNPNSTQSTSSNQTNPFQFQPVFLSFYQSSPSLIQSDIKPISTLENTNPALNRSISLSKPLTSKQNIRHKKFRTNKDIYLHYCSSGYKQCKMMRNRKELMSHLRKYHHINLDQPNSLDSNSLTLDSETLFSQQQQQSSEKEIALHCNDDTSLHSLTLSQPSSQHFVREYKLDEVELLGKPVKRMRSDEMVEEKEKLMNNDQNEEMCEEHDPDTHTTRKDFYLLLVNADIDEDYKYDGNDDELSVNGLTNSASIVTTSSQAQQSPPLQSIEINQEYDEKEITLQVKGDQLVQNVPNGQVVVPDKLPSSKHVCEHCGKGFIRRFDLTCHIRTHRPFKCPKCNMTFNQKGNKLTHLKTTHEKLNRLSCYWDRTFRSSFRPVITNECSRTVELRPCPYDWGGCTKKFTNEGDHLQKHLELIHNHHSLKYQNNIQADQLVTVPKSKAIPTGNKHVCEHCGKTFKKSYNLKTHTRTHTGEKPFVCTLNNCGKAFARTNQLKRHKFTHVGGKQYKCRDCKKLFSQRSYMLSHLKLHTGEFPHVCEHCGKGCILRSHLKVHIRKHTGERPFECPHENCEMTFAEKITMQRHFTRKHTQNEI